MDAEFMRVATDVATYVGAVSAGVSANALTDLAKGVVHKVLKRVERPHEIPFPPSPEFIEQVAAVLEADPELRMDAVGVFTHISIDRSMIIQAQTVSGIQQTNY